MSGKLKITLPKLHEGQRQVLQSKAKWRILCCGRRWGKSFICFVLALEKMFQGDAVAYITPTFNLGNSFFKDIQNYIPKELIVEVNQANLIIKLTTGGVIQFYSGEAIQKNIRGRGFNRVIIDEAAFIPNLEAIWTGDIMPTLAISNGDALFVSTPNGLDFFHSLFLRGKYKEENYESFHFPSSTSPFVSKEFLESVRKNITDDTFRQEYLAEPLATSGNPFGIEHIKKNVIPCLSQNETVVYGIDVAKYNDYTVILGLDEDGGMTYFDRYRGEWSLTKDKIKALPKQTLKVMDSTGVGDVIFEELSYTVPNIQGFKFTTSSKPQLMKELIIDVQAGNVKYNDTTAEEMMAFEYFLTSTGHPKYQAKSGYNDDAICAIAIANRFRKSAMFSRNWQLYTI